MKRLKCSRDCQKLVVVVKRGVLMMVWLAYKVTKSSVLLSTPRLVLQTKQTLDTDWNQFMGRPECQIS
jgi:hypothetical protein